MRCLQRSIACVHTHACHRKALCAGLQRPAQAAAACAERGRSQLSDKAIACVHSSGCCAPHDAYTFPPLSPAIRLAPLFAPAHPPTHVARAPPAPPMPTPAAGETVYRIAVSPAPGKCYLISSLDSLALFQCIICRWGATSYILYQRSGIYMFTRFLPPESLALFQNNICRWGAHTTCFTSKLDQFPPLCCHHSAFLSCNVVGWGLWSCSEYKRPVAHNRAWVRPWLHLNSQGDVQVNSDLCVDRHAAPLI